VRGDDPVLREERNGLGSQRPGRRRFDQVAPLPTVLLKSRVLLIGLGNESYRGQQSFRGAATPRLSLTWLFHRLKILLQ
jgi:hypothetical protein